MDALELERTVRIIRPPVVQRGDAAAAAGGRDMEDWRHVVHWIFARPSAAAEAVQAAVLVDAARPGQRGSGAQRREQQGQPHGQGKRTTALPEAALSDDKLKPYI